MEILELFKELSPIYDYEPYISFECGNWMVCWIKLGEPGSENGSDILTSFCEKDLEVAISKAYEWYKEYEK